jgi:hypothetical protein
VTDGEWAYICAPRGLPSELYHLGDDPKQEHNLIDLHPQVASRLYNAWIDFMKERGASDARLRPFVDGGAVAHLSSDAVLYGFRDDCAQWIAFPTEREALSAAYRDNAPGTARQVRPVRFGDLYQDNARNLVHLLDQYYWAEDLQ